MSVSSVSPMPPPPELSTMRVPVELSRMVGTVARHRGQSIAEYLDAAFRDQIVAHYREALAEMAASVPE